MDGANALEVAGLHRAFGAVRVLDGVDLVVAPGRMVAILGASGGGKTTLLRLVCGFELADAGRIAINGVAVDGPAPGGTGRLHVRPERRGVGYVAQDGALFPHLTVAANILFGLARTERRGAASLRRADAMLALVGLPAAYAGRLPQTLSGGEQQRVALARALAPGPRLVLLDEPFSALDAGLRAGTRRAVADALRAAGAAALLVTHDQAEALSMGDAVGVLRGGRLVQLAAPAELYRRPVDAALAGFVGEAVLLDGEAGPGAVSCALGRLPLPDGPGAGPVRVMIRPEQIVLAETGVPARVEAVSYYGHDAGVSLRLPDGALAQARIEGGAALALRTGASVGVSVRGAVVAFPLRDADEAAAVAEPSGP